jgi:hypothetical protein
VEEEEVVTGRVIGEEEGVAENMYV